MRNGQSSSKSGSCLLPNPSAVATESDNSKVSKRLIDRGVSSKSQKSESSGVATSSVVKKLDGNVSSAKAESASKNLSSNSHDDDSCSLRRSARISAVGGPVEGITDHDLLPIPARKRKAKDSNDSKLSSVSQNNKVVRKGKSLSLEILSGTSPILNIFLTFL